MTENQNEPLPPEPGSTSIEDHEGNVYPDDVPEGDPEVAGDDLEIDPDADEPEGDDQPDGGDEG